MDLEFWISISLYIKTRPLADKKQAAGRRQHRLAYCDLDRFLGL